MKVKFRVKDYRAINKLNKGINEMYEFGYKPILMTENSGLFTVVFESVILPDALLKEKKEIISLENSN